MRNIFFILLVLFFVSCSSKIPENNILVQKKYDEKTAISILEKYISRQFNEKGYSYYKTLPNLKRGLILFSWKNDDLKKYYIRYFLVSGDKKYVELVDKGSKFELSIKNARSIVNCYGYTHKLPNIFDINMKINLDQFSSNDCKSSIRYTFVDRTEAEEVASAFATILSSPEDADEVEEQKIVEQSQKSIKDVNKCGVDKILKMKEIGLSNEEIKKICE
ncbi:MAG: hypothetical protein LDL13_06615 [Calditerrivibrio sp.]|nr:hypothetical protein [Calditerrivibrio sp.]MCA1933232.1 hypothetical protein [Calditerrivibrio sp.]MCA1980738.1 hypothetical protein [Calditerrivibrio sp.]